MTPCVRTRAPWLSPKHSITRGEKCYAIRRRGLSLFELLGFRGIYGRRIAWRQSRVWRIRDRRRERGRECVWERECLGRYWHKRDWPSVGFIDAGLANVDERIDIFRYFRPRVKEVIVHKVWIIHGKYLYESLLKSGSYMSKLCGWNMSKIMPWYRSHLLSMYRNVVLDKIFPIYW